MIGRDLDKLRRAHGQAQGIGRLLENKPFQHPRISLPVGEALQAVSRLEAFLADAIDTVEAELYRPSIKG